MNIERGLAQLGVSKTADARASSASKERAEKPTFALPDHDATPSKHGFRPAHAQAGTQRASQAGAPAMREPMRTRASDDASHPEHPDDAQAPSPDTTKTNDGANAASRRESRDERRDADTQDSDAASSTTPEASSKLPTADTERRHTQADGDHTAALPDRMLALLSGAPLGASTNATPTALSGGSALAVTMADGATATPTLPGAATLAPDVGVAMRAALQPAGIPAIAGDIATTAAGPASVGATANATPTDAFAALAALADRARDGGSSSGDGTATSSTTGFAPLLARGADALQGAARTAAVVAPAPLPLMLNADFDDGLGARVVWMAEQRIDHAQIRVNPEALGPIDVRLQVDGHRVNAQFHAANADVRQAIESGMDRLRDMLGRQGMELGQAQVGSGSRQGTDGRGAGTSTAFGGGNAGDAAPTDAQVMRVALPRSRGLLDEYA